MSTATLPTDQTALLASVLARPEDDAPRLVYADWLDIDGPPECRDTARAEFIRVQIKLARHRDPYAKPPGRKPSRPSPWGRDRQNWELYKSAMRKYQQGRLAYWNARAKGLALRERERALFNGGWFDWTLPPPSPGGSRQIRMESQRSDGHTEEYVVRRGFVARVELTTAAFLGGPCGRCEVRRTHTSTGFRTTRTCFACSGSGRTPGIAAALFSAQPVTEVRLTDREPAEHVSSIDTRTYPHHRPFWFVGPQVRINEQERHWIPPEIGRLIVGDTTPGGPNAVYFDSADDARAALSAAAVRYGRGLAGVG